MIGFSFPVVPKGQSELDFYLSAVVDGQKSCLSISKRVASACWC